MRTYKNALVSVSDKTGLVDFLKPLVAQGLRIVSSGGTALHLREYGFSVVDVSEQTGFPEVMGGRVKTLHPRIHMGLLARDNSEDRALLAKEKLEIFDLVVVNLYPFEKTLLEQKSQAVFDQSAVIEKIDVGGPSMLRAASKNFAQICVASDPSDYNEILLSRTLTAPEEQVQFRRKMAARCFSRLANYDLHISHFLSGSQQELRYGENPQQSATWFVDSRNSGGLHQAQVLNGKALSYNNLLDIEAATLLVQSLGAQSCVVVKHNNPCGVAQAPEVSESVSRALAADAKSAFGGIVAVGRELDEKSARSLSEFFLEVVIAPSFSESALQILRASKNLRVLAWPDLLKFQRSHERRNIAGGFLEQSLDQGSSSSEHWQWIGAKPDAKIIEDMVFAEKVAASLKSNSIAIVQSQQSFGLGMGQVNRVDAVEQAILRMKKLNQKPETLVLASDAFFPFADSVELIAEAGIKWIVQPGGSKRDAEVIAACEKLQIGMALTGVRHFRH